MCLAFDLNGSLCSGRASPSPNANEDQSGGSGGVGGELLCARHQREGINLNRRRGGNTGLRVGDCPPCDTGQDQSGGAGCEPRVLTHRIVLSRMRLQSTRLLFRADVAPHPSCFVRLKCSESAKPPALPHDQWAWTAGTQRRLLGVRLANGGWLCESTSSN